MVQPFLPRNLILRGQVVTAEITLKPELEDKLDAKPDTRHNSENAVPLNFADLKQVRGLDLRDRNFDYADLSRSSLPKADLRYTSFKRAILRGIRLDAAQLDYAQLDNVDLNGASLVDTKLSNVNLRSADLSKAELHGAVLQEAHMFGAVLRDAEMHGADLQFAQMHSADLTNAHLSFANLSSAELYGAILQRSNLTGANLVNTKLFGATLRFATLLSADLRSAELPGADLRSVELLGANLQYADLSGANLLNAKLSGTDFTNAKLRGAIIADIRLTKFQAQEIGGQYLDALKLQPIDQNSLNLVELDSKVKGFTSKIQKPPIFPDNIQPCLQKTGSGIRSIQKKCFTEHAITPDQKEESTKVWLELACDKDKQWTKDGESTISWVALLMVKRAIDDYPWIAQPLLNAAQNQNCQGLINKLTDADKKALKEKAIEEKVRQTMLPPWQSPKVSSFT